MLHRNPLICSGLPWSSWSLLIVLASTGCAGGGRDAASGKQEDRASCQSPGEANTAAPGEANTEAQGTYDLRVSPFFPLLRQEMRKANRCVTLAKHPDPEDVPDAKARAAHTRVYMQALYDMLVTLHGYASLKGDALAAATLPPQAYLEDGVPLKQESSERAPGGFYAFTQGVDIGKDPLAFRPTEADRGLMQRAFSRGVHASLYLHTGLRGPEIELAMGYRSSDVRRGIR